MKKLLLTAAVLAAPVPAFAADSSTSLDAFLSAGVGYQDNGNDVGVPSQYDNDSVTFAVRGSAAVPLSNSIGMQADVRYSNEPLNYPAPFDVSVKSTDIAAHVFLRNSDKFLVGIIGQVNFGTLSATGESLDTKQYFIGGEAQAYLNNVTLTGQLAYRKDDFSYAGEKMDGVAATAQAKYFVHSNWSLALKGEYSRPKVSGTSYKIDQWRIGLGTENRLSSLPVSLFGNLSYGENKFDGAKLDDVRFMAGVKINFGSGTLQARDRSGASLDPFDAKVVLPAYGPA